MNEHDRKPKSLLWVLTLLIAIETQYIINGWVTGYGNNETITNYVSFAGTIVSIILAVLAIVYSYYQTFAQQRDSSNISIQISELRRLLEHADASSSAFSSALVRLQEISTKLDANSELVRASHQRIENLSGRLDQLKEKATGTRDDIEDNATSGSDQVANMLVSAAISTQIAIYKMIVAGAAKRLSLEETKTKLLHVVLKRESTKTWFEGQINACAYLLLDLQLLELDDDPERGSMAFREVNETFAAAVNEKFERIRLDPNESDPAFDLERLYKIISNT